MSVSVIVGTFGDEDWKVKAERVALPSAHAQGCEVVHVHGMTLADARNEGADRATGDWLVFLDADDELRPGYADAVEAGYGDLRQPETDYGQGPSFLPLVDLNTGNYLVIGTAVRAELFCRAGCFLDEQMYEDWSLWLRCVRRGAEIGKAPGAIYVVHETGVGRNQHRDAGLWHERIASKYARR